MTGRANVDLGALVHPWRETLLDLHLEPVETQRGEGGKPGVWLEWRFFRSDHIDNLTRALEAIQLYVLLGRADRRAWLSEEWSDVATRQGASNRHRVSRICGWQVTFERVVDGNQLCAFLSGVQSVADTRSFSPEFAHVRRALENKIPSGVPATIAISLQFCMGFGEWKRVWEVLPAVVSIATLQATSEYNHSRLGELGARLECVSFSTLPGAAKMDTSTLEGLLQLCRHGVVVTSLPDFVLDVTRENAVAFVQTLKEMLGSRSGSAVGSTRFAMLTTSTPMSTAIALATTDTTGLDYVHGRFPGDTADDRKVALQWLAYALFSHAASPHVQNTSLICDRLTLANVAPMEELLVADDPLVVLCRDLGESTLEYRHLRLAATKFFLFDPTVGDEESVALEDTWSCGLRVLGSVDKWWIVLLPGWGKAWVYTSEAQLTPATEAEEETAKPGVRAIDHLKLCDPHDLDATAALLRVVGKNLTRLTVERLLGLSEEWYTKIFQSCPELQELQFSDTTGMGMAIVASHATAITATKLERLFVTVQFIQEQNLTALAAVLEALTDRHHPLSKQLRVFAFQAIEVRQGSVTVATELVAHACRMLEENKTLELLRLILPATTPFFELSAATRAALIRHDGEKLPIRANHIAVRDKAAFLSVLRSPSSTDAMRGLDRGVVANILDFAPKPRYRNVQLVQPRTA